MIDLPKKSPLSTRRLACWVFLSALALVLSLGLSDPAAAHAELVKSSPPADSLLSAPPRRLDLWFSEAVASNAGSPSVSLLRSNGATIALRNVRVDPNDHRHVEATIPAIGPDTYTVSWTARSSDDGHVTTGTFAFSLGSARAPGAATIEGKVPRVWSVATRWLTFLGAALAAGGFLFALFLAPALDAVGADANRINQRRILAIVIGGAVGFVATILEPVLQTVWPPAGTQAPSLGDAIRGLPTAWWLRPVCLLIVVVIGAVALGLVRKQRPAPRLLELAGMGVALATLLGLSLTGHGSARSDNWRVVAIASDTLHQWATALWVGGLAQLALTWSWPVLPISSWPDPIRRFSKLALGLVVIAGATGIGNAALILPAVRSLWSSDYGYVLIGKTAILVPVLLFATFHRTKLRRLAAWSGAMLRMTVRLEAVLVLLVVLGGSTLAMLAPPALKASTLTEIDLAGPAGGTTLAPKYVVRLQVGPAKAGNNSINVKVTTPDAKPVPTSTFALVRLSFTSLEHGAGRDNLEAKPTPAGVFNLSGVELSLNGWWRVDVLLRQLGQPDLTVPFYLMLPDPNVNGMTSPPIPDSSNEAKTVFERGLKNMTSLHRVQYTQRLAGGTGTFVAGHYLVTDGTNGAPPASAIYTANYDDIIIGDKEYVRDHGGPWQESQAGPLILPNQWGTDYQGATGFVLGIKETIDGEECQVVSFYVPPRDGYIQAWFTWWVGEKTGRIHQETMVTRFHYMLNNFSAFDAPLTITAPKVAPAATP